MRVDTDRFERFLQIHYSPEEVITIMDSLKDSKKPPKEPFKIMNSADFSYIGGFFFGSDQVKGAPYWFKKELERVYAILIHNFGYEIVQKRSAQPADLTVERVKADEKANNVTVFYRRPNH